METGWRAARLAVAAMWMFAVMVGNANAQLFGKSKREEATEHAYSSECMKRYSRALCVLRAAEVDSGFGDLSVKSAARRIESKSDGKGFDAFMDLVGIGNAIDRGSTPAPGMSRGGEIGILLFQMLIKTKPAFVGSNMIVGWMPYEMAASSEEARVVMHRELMGATLRAFDGFQLEPITTPNPHNKDEPYSLSSGSEWFGFMVTGEGCGKGECKLTQWRHGYSANPYAVGLPPSDGKAPEWLGGYKAWVFKLGSNPEVMDFWVGNEMRTHRYVGRLSRELPKWAFVSVTPEHNALGRGTMNRGQFIPLLYNEGKPMTTVFPEFDMEAAMKEREKSQQESSK